MANGPIAQTGPSSDRPPAQPNCTPADKGQERRGIVHQWAPAVITFTKPDGTTWDYDDMVFLCERCGSESVD